MATEARRAAGFVNGERCLPETPFLATQVWYVCAHLTSLRASKALVGFRNLDKQVLGLAISYEVGKLTGTFRSLLPSLIRRSPCRRLYK